MHWVLCFVVLFVVIVSGTPNCSEYDLPCEDGQCISAALWCDSSEDCSDGSDEKYCKKSGYISRNPNKCPPTYFKCGNGPCIPLVGLCDGYNNCADKSDEEECEHDVSSQSGNTDSSFSSTTPATTSTTSHDITHQTSVNLDSHSKRFSNSADEKEHSVQIVYSDSRPSDYSRQRKMARDWILSQRKSDFGWGDETPRAITALYLSDAEQIKRSENDLLMMKQLEVQLSLDMARNGTKAMKLIDLALYINALLASCKDPKNFYGENLVQTLRNGVNAAQRETTFVNPSVYLTLCLNNETIYEDARKLQAIFTSANAAIGRIDIQALAMLTATCFYENTNFFTESMHEGLKRQFLHKVKPSGLPGNIYEAALLAQATRELKVNFPGLLEFILKQQQEDGSFGGILATYLALPVLAGRSFLQIQDHCSQQYTTDFAPIEVLKNGKRRKIYVQYSLNYGYPPEITQTIQMKVSEGINFLDVMRLAQEVNPKFRFMLDGNRDIPVVYSIGGIPNDAERGMFWTLHATSSGKEKGRLAPYSGNIKKLIPQAGDEYVFWMRSI